jgi:hypothetical protein
MKLVLGTILPRVDLDSKIAGPLKTVRRNGTLAPEADVPVRVVRRIDG